VLSRVSRQETVVFVTVTSALAAARSTAAREARDEACTAMPRCGTTVAEMLLWAHCGA